MENTRRTLEELARDLQEEGEGLNQELDGYLEETLHEASRLEPREQLEVLVQALTEANWELGGTSTVQQRTSTTTY